MAKTPKKKTTKKRAKKWLKGSDIRLSLTAAMAEQAADLSHKGLFAKKIAAALCVPHNTYKSWLERGREEIREYAAGDRPKSKLTLKSQLVMAIERADADLCLGVHTDILDDETGEAARSNDQKLKLLKLRWPRQYSEVRELEDDSTIDSEELKKLLFDKLTIMKSASEKKEGE